MRAHRFIGEFDLGLSRVAVRDAGLANQLKNVLRLDAGDEVALCDGKGRDARARIAVLDAPAVEFEIIDVTPNGNEPSRAITLYCALLKRENFELVLQKAVETGASRVVPLRTTRTVKLDLRLDRAVKIAREAAEQSGRGIVPAVGAPLGFSEALDDAASNGHNVMFELGATPFDAAVLGGTSGVGVFIGPEGGWDQEEVTAARERGFRIMGLGPRTLRAETAAIIATYLAASAA